MFWTWGIALKIGDYGLRFEGLGWTVFGLLSWQGLNSE